MQLGNAVIGLGLSFAFSLPLIGNAYWGAGLWKSLTLTYSGLTAIYLGTLVMPFAHHRYYSLFGVELGRRVLIWMSIAVIAGALAAAAWWWGLDGLAGLLGLRHAFHTLTDSTLCPDDVPWFHYLFAKKGILSGR